MQVANRLLPELAQIGMMSEAFDMFVEIFTGDHIERAHDARVQRRPAFMQQCVIDNLVGQRVGKRVFQFGK